MIGNIFEEDEELVLSMPRYGRAANNHNLGATQTSWLSPQTYVDKAGNVGRFIAVSALSGVNGFLESAKAVGRWAGMDAPEEKTDAFITRLDNDLGAYYQENREWADIAGLVGTSLVPGMVGVRALNAGQNALRAASAGRIGGNMSFATRLLTTRVDDYIEASATQINSTLAATRLTNLNTLKAIGTGAWQGVLETVAFETMVYATMFKNPILEAQDAGDIAKNLLIGTVLGGTVGGAFTAAGVFGKLKQRVGLEKDLRRPFVEGATFAEKTPFDQKIIGLATDLEQTPIPVRFKDAQGNWVENSYAINGKLYQDKEVTVLNQIRENIRGLTGKDDTLGNIVANASTPLKVMDGPATGFLKPGFAQEYFESFGNAKHIVRIGEDSAFEKSIKEMAKKGVPEDELPKAVSRWVILHGEDAGKVMDEAPTSLWIADTAKSPEAVIARVREFGFNVKTGNKLWSAKDLKGAKAVTEAEARFIWARHILQPDSIPEGLLVSEFDIPLLERLYKAEGDHWGKIKLVRGEGPSLEQVTINSRQELYQILKEAKEEVANSYLLENALKRGAHNPVEVVREEASKISGASMKYLDGARGGADEAQYLFRYDLEQQQLLRMAELKGLSKSAPEMQIDPLLQPRHARVVYEASGRDELLNMGYQDALAFLASKQKLWEQEAKQVSVQVLGQDAVFLPDTTIRTLQVQDNAQAGAGLFSFANSNYGTLGSSMQFIGSMTRGFKEKFRKEVTDALTNPLARLAQNQEAALEFESINRKIASSTSRHVLREFGEDGSYLIPQQFAKALDEGSITLDDIPDMIEIVNDAAKDAVRAHIQQTGQRTANIQKIHAQRGREDVKDPTVFRPIRPDLNTYKHFAFVIDDNVAGSGHVQMIHAASDKELQELISRVPPNYRVQLKDQTEEYFRARGEYEYSKGLNENYLDSDLKSKGVFSNFFPKTDPQKIVDDVLKQHLRETDLVVTEAMRLRYEHTFQALEKLSRPYVATEASQFGGTLKKARKVVEDPYTNHIKTALDISKVSEYPLLQDIGTALDTAVSRAYAAVTQSVDAARSLQDLDKTNALLQKYGMNTAYYDAALNAFANHTAPKGVLTRFVRTSNAILSRFVLGLDPFNALNNAIGSNILRTTELKHVLRAIEGGDTKIAGELAALAKVTVPGTTDSILSPGKLIANAFANFWQDARGAKQTIQKYKDMGIIKDLAEQLRLLADDFTLQGTETVEKLDESLSKGWQRAKQLTAALEKAGEKGEKVTGNALAEEMNRFVSANIMDQITSLAVKNGLMDEGTARSYINTFVNRVEGTIVASQRPVIFQGPIGQAMGLFQSYQFNLLQQMFRYVAEGSKKDLALMAGLQGTFYGLSSMPAFQFINMHLISNMGGNTERKDAYDAAYGVLGQGAGDFFLYGLPSNLLGAGIYSRGDINPRHLTIIPVDPAQYPFIQGWGKFFGSMKQTLTDIAGGGAVWESALSGLEHNGISRPLAGLAQVLRAADGGQVFSTAKDGSLLYQNDLFSWSSMVRLAGARPFDEAVVNDAMFRVKHYEAVRKESLKSLGERVKTHLYNNGQIDDAEMQEFMEAFVQRGGKQKEFNRWMMRLYKDTNVPQSEILLGKLGQPYSYKLQLLMGGEEAE